MMGTVEAGVNGGEGPAAPRFHANAMQTHAGPFDLAIEFGYRQGNDDPVTQCTVTMSWEHAVATVEALRGIIAQYEEHVGSVPRLEPLTEEEK